jgi:DNA polymerase III sliding clamp (beta) subunit (PCNA family)
MLEALRLVKGAVAKKDLTPVLTHFHVYDGRIQGTNGRLTLDAPCPDLTGLNFTVPADRFLKAVDACQGEPNLKVTPAGKLSITKGSFRALLPLGDHDAFPVAEPDTEIIKGRDDPMDLIPALTNARPFAAEDASRPWACGVLLNEDHAYATNNVAIIRTRLEGQFPEPLNIPSFAVDELLRLKHEPDVVTQDPDGNHVTFQYKDGSWLRTTVFALDWPDVDPLFQQFDEGAHGIPRVPNGLLEAVETVLPFAPDPKAPVIRLGADGVATEDGEMQASVGGYELPESAFRAEVLTQVLGVATHFDASNHPSPCPFYGPTLEGVMVGVRQ